MQTMRKIFPILLAMLICSLAMAQGPAFPGQSRTPLPDGHALLLGGFDQQKAPMADAFILSAAGAPQKLPGGMNVARAGHTATVLPDGTVFIFGGLGIDGKIVTIAELFDPVAQQFSLLPDVFAVPRAFHTATLLTDGSLLLAGGTMAGGQFPDDVQLLDYRNRKALSYHALLNIPRQGHTATLLADGTVRISGGSDSLGRPAQADEIYDPTTRRFRFASSVETIGSNLPLGIAASIPEDGAADVPLQNPISLRFTQLLNVVSATGTNFVLTGPDQIVVATQVTAAEGGRLVFVLPQAPLQPGTHYVLTISNAKGSAGDVLSNTIIAFDTEGAPPDGPGLDWVPNDTWTDPGGTTKFQQLPSLQARPGVTALSGQVLKLNGWPLRNVTLEIEGGPKTRTDSTGRFLLKDITPGQHVLWIDGNTANHANATYGIYPVQVTVVAKRTNSLNYTIWMTRLDVAHSVNIPSPTNQAMTISNPDLPGVELHLPKGTVIRDRFGRIVRQITITPVPLDKPPFPLPPGLQLPVFFVIQPGGAQITVLDAKEGADGAQLVYPNRFHLKPGTPFAFWNYDPQSKGWYIYGQGSASADGSSLIPDPGVQIYEFTAAGTGPMSGNPNGAPTEQPCPLGSPRCWFGEPVSMATGQFIYRKTDLTLADTLPIAFTRTYVTNDSQSRAFGIGMTHSYNMFLVGDGSDTTAFTYQELILPDGSRVRFDRVSPGTGASNPVYVHVTSGSEFYGARITHNQSSWILTLKNGTTYTFPSFTIATSPACQAPSQVSDRFGNTITLTRTAFSNSPTSCELTTITSPNGRSISLSYDNQGRVIQAQDSAGRTVSYFYDSSGRLSSVTDAGGGVTSYTYDSSNRMLTVTDPRNIVYLTNQYDSAGRVVKQTQADNSTYLFSWTPTANTNQLHIYQGFPSGSDGTTLVSSGCWDGFKFQRNNSACNQGYMPLVAQVDLTDPRGYVERVVFNSYGYPTSDTHALGQPEQEAITYAYYADNTLQSVTDALGRVTSFDYDAFGNRTRVTRLDGTSNAVTETFSYQSPFNQLASVTDPLGHSGTFSYDPLGNLTAATDALNHQTIFTHDGNGRITAVTDALNNTVQFAYFGGDLVSVTDPLGNVSIRYPDAAGRIISATDAMGNTVKTQYGPLNLVTQVNDAIGNSTTFNYDGNGNLLSLTDAMNHTMSWTYDNMDRVATRQDALQRQKSYSYDQNGNLASSTDRKGQVTSVTYDGLNRPTFVGYNTVVNGGVTSYESTVSYTYDGGNRMTQVVDTTGGTITDAYDNLNRLTTETTAQGSISYGYDNGNRRTIMTVAGQPQVSYAYDNANRLTQMTQGNSTVALAYDNAGRRTSQTLPNGVGVSYSYDNGSRITGITYQSGNNILGTLAYAYDSVGRRTQMSGSFASTNLPGAVNSAVYDAASELTSWNGSTITYDANGSMQSDGTNTFTWNARNQMATLNSVSLQYDAFGRRLKNAVGTSFLYDRANASQEISGSTPTANIWMSGLDELLQRSDSSGTVVPLADALDSTIALVNSSGMIATSYHYDPFGNTTTTGTASGNPAQYTGRENEGIGLYFYRARYYSPTFGRFISEDPSGFGGGSLSLYVYAGDDPINLTDPSGRNPYCLVGALAGSMAFNVHVLSQVLAGRKINYYGGWEGVARVAQGNLAWAGVGCVLGSGYGLALGGGAAVTGGLVTTAGAAGTVVTSQGLQTIAQHLESLEALEYPPNQAMLEGLQQLSANGEAATGAYQNFYLHELEEASNMAQGMNYDLAHQTALETFGHSPFSVYAPEVIQRFGPTYFNDNWFEFWGLK